MYVGEITRIVETPVAIRVTTSSRKYIYLPRSQVEIVNKQGHHIIYVPDWIINKNRINWNDINEIIPIGRRTEHEHGLNYSHSFGG